MNFIPFLLFLAIRSQPPATTFQKVNEVVADESGITLQEPRVPYVIDDSLIVFISGQSDILIYNYQTGHLYDQLQLEHLSADSLVFTLFAPYYPEQNFVHIRDDDAFARSNKVSVKGYGYDAKQEQFVFVIGLQAKYTGETVYKGDTMTSNVYPEEIIFLITDKNLNATCLIPFYPNLPHGNFPMTQGHWIYSGNTLISANIVVRKTIADTFPYSRFLVFQLYPDSLHYQGELSHFHYKLTDAKGPAYYFDLQYCNYKKKTYLAVGNQIMDLNGKEMADATPYGQLYGFTLNAHSSTFEASKIDSVTDYLIRKAVHLENGKSDSLTIGLSSKNSELAFYKNRLVFMRLTGENYSLITYEIH